MRHIAAYLLLVLGGTQNPTAEDIKKVLSAAGIEGDDARIKQLLEELAGKDPYALMAEGTAKLAQVGGGGGGGSGGNSGGAGGDSAPAEEAAAEEEEEEESEEMELDLFG
eukprot:TRINITY_DN538_c0_g2_i1.p2 TRINITY_DN538_c0_g2~~TRINITY_DN538_c0_g2_i1.p2  ORF type:complete len:110 (+),score=3.10 TRINITY_DN538_c0_g2_i1:72-401(+)